MSLFSGDIEDMKALYITKLRHLLSTEQQIIKALPKMADSATDEQLKNALLTHLQETELHEDRLKDVLSALTDDVDEKKCAVTAALISAGETVISDTTDPAVRDAGIIAAAQQVEHFEIAAYGTAKTWAETLGYPDQTALLDKTLKEEGNADKLLTQISGGANARASYAA